MRRSLQLLSPVIFCALALTACSGSPTEPSSSGIEVPTVAASSTAPVSSTTPSGESTAQPTSTSASTSAGQVEAPSQKLKAQAKGLAKKLDGWLQGWSYAGCEGLDLSGGGKAIGCLNQAKGAPGVAEGVARAWESAGAGKAGGGVDAALKTSSNLVTSWKSNRCYQDVRSASCVDAATQFPSALKSLKGELEKLS